MTPDIRWVDPRELRVLPSRSSGADLLKLQRQFAKFGTSDAGMPPLVVCEATDGTLVVYDGVTRASRIAKLSPGKLVCVEVIGKIARAFRNDPQIGDLLP